MTIFLVIMYDPENVFLKSVYSLSIEYKIEALNKEEAINIFLQNINEFILNEYRHILIDWFPSLSEYNILLKYEDNNEIDKKQIDELKYYQMDLTENEITKIKEWYGENKSFLLSDLETIDSGRCCGILLAEDNIIFRAMDLKNENTPFLKLKI